jgi:chemotaxis protein CheD
MKFVPSTKEGESQDGVVSRFLNPGGFFFGSSNCQIHTILGSCIAITLWHPKLQIGGMCHFVLPGRGAANNVISLDSQSNGRYSDAAMLMFEREANRHGTNLKEYQAKIFGGSNMLTNSTLREDDLIGTKNTEAAIKHLTERGISLLVAHVGETGHRRIAFDVENGDVWVKHEPLQKTIG